MTSIENNKRIVKNTLLLYVRQLFVMIITLYTSRVVLNALGVVDYGIYNVVGGVVTMISFLNGTMAAATQRYISFELGRNNFQQLQKVFSTTLQIHGFISLIVVLLAETIGLWLFYNKMQIPVDRIMAALVVYQCSVLSVVISIMSVPYNADIIAHEKMSAFAYITILEVVLRLFCVYMLTICLVDKLILYAILLLGVYLFIRLCYGYYCNRHFPESKYKWIFDKLLLKEIFAFAGWNMLANIASALNSQGTNIVLNIFFGPAVNAARGIAVQVQTAANQFCTNFQMAVNPQMTKSYAIGNYSETNKLMNRSSLFSFYLLLMMTLPLFFETESILVVWLKIVPAHTATFIRIMLCCILLWTFSSPMNTVAYSTGNIKGINVVHSCIVLQALPLSWVFLKCDAPVFTPFIVIFILEFVSQLARMFMLKKVFPYYSIRKYCIEVYFKAFIVLVVSLLLPVITFLLLSKGLLATVVNCVVSFCSVCISVYFLGMTQNERTFVRSRILSKILDRK